VARRPRWIAALVLALGIAAAFAALGQWQIARSIESATVIERETEKVVELEAVTEPGRAPATAVVGQVVSTSGTLVAGDYVILSGRNNDSEAGYWVTGHLVTEAGPSLAVALGWAPTEEAAHDAVAELEGDEVALDLEGRYLPSEAPQEGDFETAMTRMSVASLLNLWADAPDSVYAGYVIAAEPATGLEAISAPAPESEVSLNWLNLFYAAEWAIFAGFAIFLWWRVVKDVWEREQEEGKSPVEATVE
jgi:cytochrome oxidase assembly protein ShyY1